MQPSTANSIHPASPATSGPVDAFLNPTHRRLESASTTNKPHVAGERPAQTVSENLIDWNACQPDGSEAVLQQLLGKLGQAIGGELLLAYEHHRSLSRTHLSNESWIHSSADQQIADSVVLEATRALSGCLFASEASHNSGVLKNFLEHQACALVLAIGVVVPGVGSPSALRTGLVVCVKHAHLMRSRSDYTDFLSKVQRELPVWMQAWRLCAIAKKSEGRRHLLADITGRKGLLAVCGLLLFALACFIQVPYRPSRECVVEPAARSFVASPIDGKIVNAVVKPGDRVTQGQLLAKLDSQDIEWKLSSAEAEYQTAQKKRDTALATRAGGDLRLAQLEQQRIGLEIEALTERRNQLELRSPMDGIIVQGDWFQSDGAPVSRGDTLFEIAPLARMKLETHLSTDDLATIRVGVGATVHVDAAQGTSWQGALTRIDTRGQVIESEVVFIADMEIANDQQLLRPGMKGSVRIDGGAKSIGWLLFNRPYVWVMKKLAW